MRKLSIGVGVLALTTASAIVLGAGPAGAAAPTAATSAAGCQVRFLDLPPGADVGAYSVVQTGDRTGRYLAGRVERTAGHLEPVLWTDGVPRWLDPQLEGLSYVDSVTTDGTVLGYTWDPAAGAAETAWLYRHGTFRTVAGPPGLDNPRLMGMNNRGDIVGSATDPATGREVPIVRSAQGQWTRLAVDFSGGASLISDDGIVIGGMITGGLSVRVMWSSWTAAPQQLTTESGDPAAVSEIRSGWIAGSEVGPDVPPGGPTPDPRGLLWNSSGVFQRSYDVMTTSVNSSGDVALVPGTDSQAEIVRANGADVKLGSGSNLAYLIDRGRKLSGAGFVGYPASETNRAATWSGC